MEALFSGLPWWIKCKGCRTRLRLSNQPLFWQHASIFAVIALASGLLFSGAEIPLVFPILVLAEAVIYVLLLMTILLNTYGLERT